MYVTTSKCLLFCVANIDEDLDDFDRAWQALLDCLEAILSLELAQSLLMQVKEHFLKVISECASQDLLCPTTAAADTAVVAQSKSSNKKKTFSIIEMFPVEMRPPLLAALNEEPTTKSRTRRAAPTPSSSKTKTSPRSSALEAHESELPSVEDKTSQDNPGLSSSVIDETQYAEPRVTQVHLACIIRVINLLYAAHASFGMDCGTQNEDSEVEDPISTGTEERILQGAEQTKPPHSEAEGKSESIGGSRKI